MNEILLQLEGNVNDLLSIDRENGIKATRFVMPSNIDPENGEIIDIAITSSDPTDGHMFFDENLLGENIRITIERID